VKTRALGALWMCCLAVVCLGAGAPDKNDAAYLKIRRLLGSSQYAKAVGEARKAIRQEPDSWRAHESLVESYQRLGALPEAVRELRELIAADPENPRLHYALGLAHQNAKEDALALESFRRAIELAPAFPLAYRELAFEHRQLGTLADAVGELERQSADQASNVHYGLGFVYNFQGETAKALEHLERAIALDPELLDAYRYASQVRLARGDFQAALSLSRELLRRAELRGDLQYQTFALNAMGTASVRLADYAHAVAYYLDALSLQRQLGDRQGQWSTLNGLGMLHDTLGVSDKALAFHNEALVWARTLENPRWKGTTLHNIGVNRLRQGDATTARRYYREALKIRVALKDAREQAYTLADIGASYVRQNRVAEGLRHLEEAERNAAQVEDAFLAAVIQTSLGEAYERGAAEAEASTHYGQALQMAERIHHDELVWRAERGLGACRLRQGRLPEALEHYARAIRTVEGLRQHVQDEAARTVFLQGKLAAYEGIVALLYRLHEASPGQGYDRQALQYAQRVKARAFLELLAEAKAEIRRGMKPEQLDEEHAILREMARLQRGLLQASLTEARRKGLETELTEVEGRLERFRDTLRRTSPEYAAVRYPEPEPLEALQSELLDEHSLLIEFMLGEEKSFAWLVSDHGVEMVALPGRAALEAKVGRYGALIRRPPAGIDAMTTAVSQGRELFRILLGAFAARISKARRLLVVPDGVLHYLPFESLVSSVDARGRAHYLLEALDVAYAPSASVLADLDRRPKAAGELELLAYGAPDLPGALTARRRGAQNRSGDVARGYFRERGIDLGPLPQAKRELQSIAQLFPEKFRKVCIGGSASESAFKKEELGRFRIVHFATHGIMDDEAPSRSGLLLSPGDGDEDGLLQGLEVLNLKIDADMVVLSACGTGLGRLVRGEGLVGLSRAFFYAGARSLVVSLWNVDDQSTAQTMQAFYSRLRAGAGRAAALREAKRELLRSDRPAYRFPYYWAPFVLLGRIE
jgi:CHAT domain-containing protein/tetratricopeptide (TPR) repeat protein